MSFFSRILQALFGTRPAPPPPSVPPASPRTPPPSATADASPSFTTTWFVNPTGSAVQEVATPAGNPGSAPPAAAARQAEARRPHGPPSVAALEASAFLPITREDIKKEMKGTSLWGSAWWGRRDLIPPVTDTRTKVIDRGMVSQGLISPEQLAEIHRVGAEMDLVRPHLAALRHQSDLAGQAAVEADRDVRKLLKEQKQAEAAARRQARAERIALRKATDILYLGRGVSGRLNDRTSDAGRLEALGLPVLSTPAQLAAALGLEVPQLRWLAFHSDVAARTHYVHFTVPKKSGGTRTLSAPHARLSAAQHWILVQILQKLPTEPAAQGFVPGRSILTNARQHAGRQVVINMDLEGFFPSIVFPRVRSVFARAGYSPAVATILALLCTESPRRTVQFNGQTWHVATGPRGLPQGACTSPALSNQVARRLDKRFQGLAARLGLTYTRYADDLTFSGDDALRSRAGYVMARVRHIAGDEGFAVNETKTRVLRRNAAQTVTGLIVNDTPGVARSEVRRIRAILHQARTTGLAAQNREQHPNFSAWLEGKIAYISMARPEVGARLRQDYLSLREASR